MYRTSDGEELFVVDGHTHFWDAAPANQRNIHGKQFIDCFYAYHSALSPEQEVWPKEKFEKYDAETMVRDLFVDGPVDMAIIQPTYLKEFYIEGFNTTEQNAVITQAHPDRFILNGSFDPREGTAALEHLHALKEAYGIRGVKLYTAEWRGASRGWRLNDTEAYRCFELCEKLGITNMHVHKGPTITPLAKDAFDCHDVDYAATDFPNLNFIVEHVGLPRLDDFCWIAVQEENVWGGLAVVMPFMHARPRYFAEVIAELLFWVGEDKLTFASDYAIWTPKWLVEKFWAFELPEDIKQERGVDLTPEIKKKILGLNAARLYDIDIDAAKAKLWHS